jgi:TP901 family phage tail tape measure protein
VGLLPPMLVEIVAKNSEAIAKMRETSAEADKMAAKAAAAGEKSGTAFQKMQGVSKAALLAVAGSAIVVGVESVKMAAEFQESTKKLEGSAGITSAAATNIGKAFLATAGTTQYSAQQMVDAYGPVARQLQTVQGHALSSGEAIEFMKAAQDLAEASGGNLSSTTATLGAVMRTYSIGVKDAGEASNTLFNASTLLNVPIGDVANAVDKLHGRLGVAAPSLTDTAALMADLGEHGVTGSRGLMVANTAFGTLMGGSKSTAAELKSLGVNIYDAHGKFIGMKDAIAQLSPKLVGLSDVQKVAAEKALFGAGAAGVMNGVINGGAESFERASKAVEKHGSVENAAARNASTLQGQLKIMFATMKDLGVMIGTALLPPLQDALKGFMGFFNYLKDNQGVAKALGITVAVLVGGLASLYAITKTVQFAQAAWAAGTKLVAAAQWVLNAAMDANPIGVVVVAIGLLVGGFILAYNKIGWFKDGVNAAFGFVKQVIGNVGKWFTDVLVPGWNNAVGAVVKYFGDLGAAVDIVMGSIKTYIGNVGKWFTGVLVPTWNLAVGSIGKFFTDLGNTISNIMGLIKATMGAAWNWIKNTVINAWTFEIKGMAAIVTWLWKNVIVPTFEGIKNALNNAWTWIKSNVIDAFVLAVKVWGAIFTWLWKNVIVPTFEGIKNALNNAWTWIKSNVIDAFVLAVKVWGAIFTWLWKNAVSPAFDGIKNVASAGWTWVRDNVFTPFKQGINGIGTAFDNTQKFIATAWNKIKEAAAAPVRWIVNTVYTNGIEKVWNGIASKVGVPLQLPNVSAGFADGGVYGTRPGYTPGRDTHLIAVSGGEAIMRPEWARAIGHDGVNHMNGLAKRGGVGAVRKAMGFADGGITGFLGGVGGFIGDTAHNVGSVVGGVGHALAGAASGVASFLADPIGSIANLIVGPIKAMQHLAPGGSFGQMAFQLPINVVEGLGAKAKELIAGLGGGSNGSGNGGSGVQRWAPDVLRALSMTGQPASLLNTTLRRMNQESGGNPQAINLTDSNAAMGDPSKGLMQVIGGTFAQYAMPGFNSNIYDPMSNILASMRYAISRYGSLAGAYNQAGGYANGGVVPVFDQGGWVPPGVSMIHNKTGAPERLSNTTHGGGGHTINVTTHTNATGQQIAAEIGWALARQN